MAQTNSEKAKMASIKRRFSVGDNVLYLTSKQGSVQDDFLASGKVTEIKNKNIESFNQSKQFVTAILNDKDRKVTGKIGIEAPSNHFIMNTDSNKNKNLILLKNKFLIEKGNKNG